MVWAPVLGGNEERAQEATRTIDGPHVTHYWDPDAAGGRWFAENMPWDHGSGPAWDVFYLFDADAAWKDAPDPVIAWGYTIVGERASLEAGLGLVLD